MLLFNRTVISALLLLGFSIISQAQYFSEFDQRKVINFVHHNGDSQDFFYPEIVGSGVAFLDHDNDGDLDLYLVQSGAFENNKQSDQFYQNLLVEAGDLSFKEISKTLQLNNTEYGIGIATTDFNQDGWVDFYLANLNNNQLFINQKGKGFVELPVQEQGSWSASASFCDINNDGYEDLYVSNYVNWSQENNPKCYNGSSKRDYCGPNSFEGLKDDFYINDQGSGLVNKTTEYFSNMPKMPGLNVVCTDVNNDGWDDFIVANDGKANLLWLNQQGKSFKEAGLFSGLAVNAEGVAEASMGMAVADYDLDGDEDVFFTHLMNESNTLYKNNGKGFFQDVTNRSKLSRESFAYTGWATGFLHVNSDIFPDLIIFNGAVADASNKENMQASLAQSNQLFLADSNRQFRAVTNQSWLTQKEISRGAAFGDVDNDGDIDIIANNNNGQAQLFLNNLNPKKWLGLNIKVKNTDKIKIHLIKDNEKTFVRMRTDGAYASAHDDRLVLHEAQLNHYQRLQVSQSGKVILDKILKPENTYITVELK